MLFYKPSISWNFLGMPLDSPSSTIKLLFFPLASLLTSPRSLLLPLAPLSPPFPKPTLASPFLLTSWLCLTLFPLSRHVTSICPVGVPPSSIGLVDSLCLVLCSPPSHFTSCLLCPSLRRWWKPLIAVVVLSSGLGRIPAMDLNVCLLGKMFVSAKVMGAWDQKSRTTKPVLAYEIYRQTPF